MNEPLERESPATVVECPICEGRAELQHDARAMRCDGCGVTVAIAPDEPPGRSRGTASPIRRPAPRPTVLVAMAG